MPESPKQWYDRAIAEGYRTLPFDDWTTWPFTGELTPKPLDPPVETEPLRRGSGERAASVQRRWRIGVVRCGPMTPGC